MSAFDAFNPPSAEQLSDCVHCGFCLPSCPTYALDGEEMDSPRGRIWLMQLGLEGEAVMDDTYVSHFDACLGCMACVSACPSGVAYDELIEATRAQIERRHDRGLADRAFRAAVFALFPHPRRLRAAALAGWLLQRSGADRLLTRLRADAWLPARLQALRALQPRVTLAELRRRTPARSPAAGGRRLTVGLLTGCVQSVYFSAVNAATVRVLTAEGCDVIAPPEQGCCGALGVHAGREEGALALARRTVDVFDAAEVDVVVTTAAGCGSTMKDYGRLLRADPVYADRAAELAGRVRDISEVIADLPPRAPRHPLPAAVTYHDACHLAHAQGVGGQGVGGQGVRAQPRAMLRSIPQLDLRELPDDPESQLCCGSAGIYNLLEPSAAEQLGRRKAAALAATAPQAVVSGNPGCLLQLRRHLPGVPVLHPIELLDAAIRGTDPFASRPP